MEDIQFVLEAPHLTQGHKKRPRLVTSCDNWYVLSSSSPAPGLTPRQPSQEGQMHTDHTQHPVRGLHARTHPVPLQGPRKVLCGTQEDHGWSWFFRQRTTDIIDNAGESARVLDTSIFAQLRYRVLYPTLRTLVPSDCLRQ